VKGPRFQSTRPVAASTAQTCFPGGAAGVSPLATTGGLAFGGGLIVTNSRPPVQTISSAWAVSA